MSTTDPNSPFNAETTQAQQPNPPAPQPGPAPVAPPAVVASNPIAMAQATLAPAVASNADLRSIATENPAAAGVAATVAAIPVDGPLATTMPLNPEEEQALQNLKDQGVVSVDTALTAEAPAAPVAPPKPNHRAAAFELVKNTPDGLTVTEVADLMKVDRETAREAMTSLHRDRDAIEPGTTRRKTVYGEESIFFVKKAGEQAPEAAPLPIHKDPA